MQSVKLFLQRLQLATHRQQGIEYVRCLIDTLFVMCQHLTGSSQFETAYLDKVMDKADLLNIFILLLANLG